MYTLIKEQFVQATIAEVWAFLKNPSNLDLITPPDLQFEIISLLPEEMFDGLIIEYRINLPMFGKRQWVAEIKHIREKCSFVDEQRMGPYRFWYHYHAMVQEGGQVKIIDKVHYALPFGPFGRLLHGVYVGGILDRIFRYRKDKLAEILNS